VNEANLVSSLLQAIVNIDGDALVMHSGDKPYVVSPSGQVELASRGLTLEAVNGIVMQMLPAEYQQALDEFGAIQYALTLKAEFPNERFTVVVSRDDDDVWAEVRRRRIPDDDAVPLEMFDMPSASAPEQPTLAPSAADVSYRNGAVEFPRTLVEIFKPIEPVHRGPVEELSLHAETAASAVPPPALTHSDAHPAATGSLRETPPAPAAPVAPPPAEIKAVEVAATISPPPPAVAPRRAEPVVEPEHAPLAAEAPLEALPSPSAASPIAQPVVAARPSTVSPPDPAAPSGSRFEPPVEAAPAERPATPAPPPRLAPPPAVVLPMSRSPIRNDQPQAGGGDTFAGLERLLRTAAARGASTLYLSSDARPSVRVDGDLQSLDGEPVHTAADVISLLLSLMPDRSHEALRTGATTEWICDIEEIGRVRCMSFSDYRGPGGVFRLMPVRTISADQLGLSREIQLLAAEPEGLVLIAGSRSSGKRALISSLIDLVNRTRRDHIITIEREVNIVHDRGNSFISQREVRGTDDDVLAAARAALREDPDVLVLDQIRSGLLMNVALEAAASGHLVVGGFSAHNVTESIDRILGLYAPEYARQVQLALADNLRGVVAQVLLPKIGGGRVAAREVLLNTPPVASVIAEGKTSQLPMAIESGRRAGMVPFNDALVAYVQSGIVDLRDAYRYVTDRPAFLALLKRQGVDTSDLERFA
jgi:twitching motility protein PilT